MAIKKIKKILLTINGGKVPSYNDEWNKDTLGHTLQEYLDVSKAMHTLYGLRVNWGNAVPSEIRKYLKW